MRSVDVVSHVLVGVVHLIGILGDVRVVQSFFEGIELFVNIHLLNYLRDVL